VRLTITPVIELLLPAEAAVSEAFDDPAGVPLFPEEAALIAGAVDKRRREFTTVRYCARQAMAKLGFEPAPVLHGARGVPLWPTGVVGSMTHCQGYRAAVLGRTDDFVSIGVDAEEHAPLPDGVLDAIALPQERARIADLRESHPAVCWDRLLFSAKESVYKTWFPLTGRWLDFDEADIVLEPETSSFVAHLLVPGPQVAGCEIRAFHGRFLVENGFVLTAISLSTAAAVAPPPVTPAYSAGSPSNSVQIGQSDRDLTGAGPM
jgi:4'-phosphopantetheinyl transferase EntD